MLLLSGEVRNFLTTNGSSIAGNTDIQLTISVQNQNLTGILGGSNGNLLVGSDSISDAIASQSSGSAGNTSPSNVRSGVSQLHVSNGVDTRDDIDLTTGNLNDIASVNVGQLSLSLLGSNLNSLAINGLRQVGAIDHTSQLSSRNGGNGRTVSQSRDLDLVNSSQSIDDLGQQGSGSLVGRDLIAHCEALASGNLETSTQIGDISRVCQIYGIPIGAVVALQSSLLNSSHKTYHPFDMRNFCAKTDELKPDSENFWK